MPKFNFDSTSYFANMRKQGISLSAEQEAAAEKVIRDNLKDGDIVSGGINGFMAAVNAILSFLGLGNLGLGDRLSAAMDNGQQEANKHTATETAYYIRQGLIANGIPVRTAEAMTGDVSNQPELAGNLYRVFRADPNGGGPAINPPAASPDMSQLAQSNGSYPVTDNPTVLAQNTPAAGQPTRALTGNTPAA